MCITPYKEWMIDRIEMPNAGEGLDVRLAYHGSRDGAVVRAFASHRCGPGSIPGPGVSVCCWFSPCSEGFSPVSPVFLPPQKPTLEIPIRSGNEGHGFVSFAVKCYPH